MPIQKLSNRFREILDQAAQLEGTRKQTSSEWGGTYVTVDAPTFLGWKVKARNLFVSACGIDSEHYKQFVETEKHQSYRESWDELQELRAIVFAAQEDYDGGHLDAVRSLVQAELFSDELDQARALLDSSYKAPAAVVAGTVLETKLRDMCAAAGIPTGKLDKMNADLARAAAYTVLVQKRITALADIRNSAAHGHPEKFSNDDVADMISYIERFVADHS